MVKMKGKVAAAVILLSTVSLVSSLGYTSYTLCPRLQSPGNGRVSVTGLTFGSTAVYTCFFGTILQGSRFRRCLQGGIWSGVAPTCRSPVVCPALGSPSNGNVNVNGRSPGDIASYSCNSGFTLEPLSSSTRVCRRTGQWSGSNPVCRANRVNCGDPGTPNNGRRVLRSTFEGDIVQYFCFQNFELEGDQQRTCLSNGQWSGSLPLCTPIIDCGRLNAPSNGQVSQTGTTAGSTASYTCDSGFSLQGPQNRVCQANGLWSGNDPICVRNAADCGQLSSPQNGRVDLTGTSEGSVAIYSCQQGFNLVGNRRRRCQQNGQWSGVTPRCERRPVDCGVLSNPANGFVSFDSTSPSSVAVYRCEEGFSLVGNRQRVCRRNGQWSGTEPLCRRIQISICGPLSNPANGEVVITDDVIATYFCARGFFVSQGSRRRVCQANGEWSGTMPQCERRIGQLPPPQVPLLPIPPNRGRDCEPPPDPVNGEVIEMEDAQFNLFAIYECDTGFNLIGQEIRFCQEDGTYNGRTPRCVAGPRPPLPFPPGQRPPGGRPPRPFPPGQRPPGGRPPRPFPPGQRPPGGRPSRPFPPGQRPPGGRPFRPFRPGQRPPFRPGQRPPFRPGQRPPFRPGQRPPFRPGQRPPFRPGQRPPFRPGQRPPRPFPPGQRPPLPPPTGGTCPHLPPPKEGLIKVTGFEVGDTATYSCFEGFELAGEAVRTCTIEGTWSLSEPACVPRRYLNQY